MSYDIFLAFQRCFPSSSLYPGPLIHHVVHCYASPFLVIHEIYTREVRTRSFGLIITFFHHPFPDISENTRPPSLGLTLFMCHPATYVRSRNVSVHCTAEFTVLQKKKTKIEECFPLLTFKKEQTCWGSVASSSKLQTRPDWLSFCSDAGKRAVPLVSVVGDGFFGISEKLLPSRPELLHSFFSVAVGAEVSMLLSGSCHDLESQERQKKWELQNLLEQR